MLDWIVFSLVLNFSDEERIYEDVPNNCENKKNVIAVKEYSPVSAAAEVTETADKSALSEDVTETDTDQVDLVFIHVNGTVASSWVKHKKYINIWYIHASIRNLLRNCEIKFEHAKHIQTYTV